MKCIKLIKKNLHCWLKYIFGYTSTNKLINPSNFTSDLLIHLAEIKKPEIFVLKQCMYYDKTISVKSVSLEPHFNLVF